MGGWFDLRRPNPDLSGAVELKRELLDRILGYHQQGQACALLTHIQSGRQSITGCSPPNRDPDELFNHDCKRIAQANIFRDRSELIDTASGQVFIQVFNPPLRLFIIGAVHIAQALAPLARVAGYAVTVIDPRRAFATDNRFTDVTLCHQWPDDALDAAGLNHRSAVVTLSHDPKIDDAALGSVLASEAFYIGALGSRRTHTARCERLKAQGCNNAALARIHAPVGLPIGATSAAEIAVAIIAESIQTLRLTKRKMDAGLR